jgi:hypothetical protein
VQLWATWVMWASTWLVKIPERVPTFQWKSLVHYELKQHTPWFDEDSSKLLHKKRQSILQWLKKKS